MPDVATAPTTVMSHWGYSFTDSASGENLINPRAGPPLQRTVEQ